MTGAAFGSTYGDTQAHRPQGAPRGRAKRPNWHPRFAQASVLHGAAPQKWSPWKHDAGAPASPWKSSPSETADPQRSPHATRSDCSTRHQTAPRIGAQPQLLGERTPGDSPCHAAPRVRSNLPLSLQERKRPREVSSDSSRALGTGAAPTPNHSIGSDAAISFSHRWKAPEHAVLRSSHTPLTKRPRCRSAPSADGFPSHRAHGHRGLANPLWRSVTPC